MSNILTVEGLEKLKNELREIKEIKLKAIAARIKEAKDLGDLSENAEYHSAKDEQAFLHGKALEIESKIRNAQVIEKGKCVEVVEVGCSIEVESEGEKTVYEIVGSDESDPLKGRISIESPIGTALAGHKAKDTVVVNTPVGETEYKILRIF